MKSSYRSVFVVVYFDDFLEDDLEDDLKDDFEEEELSLLLLESSLSSLDEEDLLSLSLLSLFELLRLLDRNDRDRCCDENEIHDITRSRSNCRRQGDHNPRALIDSLEILIVQRKRERRDSNRENDRRGGAQKLKEQRARQIFTKFFRCVEYVIYSNNIPRKKVSCFVSSFPVDG